jgi:hypothetical protein
MPLSSIQILQITKVGVTRRGTIYITYATQKGNCCSFVSLAEIRAALGIENSSAALLAKVASDRTSDLITYNRSFFLLPEHIFIKRQIEKTVTEKSLTAIFAEEEGELFARVYHFQQFLGIINVSNEGKIFVTNDKFNGKYCFSTAGALGLLCDQLPRRCPTEAEIAQQNRSLRGGTFVGIDGTIHIDERFYQLMGKVSQIRGRRR